MADNLPEVSHTTVYNIAEIALSFTMLLGRLDVFSLLILFTPVFWRR